MHEDCHDFGSHLVPHHFHFHFHFQDFGGWEISSFHYLSDTWREWVPWDTAGCSKGNVVPVSSRERWWGEIENCRVWYVVSWRGFFIFYFLLCGIILFTDLLFFLFFFSSFFFFFLFSFLFFFSSRVRVEMPVVGVHTIAWAESLLAKRVGGAAVPWVKGLEGLPAVGIFLFEKSGGLSWTSVIGWMCLPSPQLAFPTQAYVQPHVRSKYTPQGKPGRNRSQHGADIGMYEIRARDDSETNTHNIRKKWVYRYCTW